VAPVYELFAVLIHRGLSASSGHYIAVIKDPVTGVTYKFNDTEVQKEKKFSLANEEDSGIDSFHVGLLELNVGVISISQYHDIDRQPHVVTIPYNRLHLRYRADTTT